MYEQLGQLLSPDLCERAFERGYYPHPWFRDEPGVPWGLIYRMGALVGRSELYDPYSTPAQQRALRLHPLYAQPVVELCLSIPLYVHFLNGCDRGLARSAFAEELPQPIARRQWKDRNANVNTELVANNLPLLRELMLDGVLVRKGYLDRAALERALSHTPQKGSADLSVLLQHLDIELWALNWADQQMKAAA